MRRFRTRKTKFASENALNKEVLKSPLISDGENLRFSPDIAHNEQILKEVFRNCSDIIFREVQIEEDKNVLMIYVESMTEMNTFNSAMFKPGMFQEGKGGLETIGQVISQQMSTRKTIVTDHVEDTINEVLKGSVAFLMDGESKALLTEMRGFEKRAIEEPSTENTVRGPRDGFTESLRTNVSLVRRRIKSPLLKMEAVELGRLTHTDVIIAYIEGVANDSVVEEVRRRVGRIQTDAILESGYIEEFIQDRPYSIFPQALNTERPDVVAGNLLEGKVAILVDGTPFALIVPTTFWSEMQAPDDYYHHFIYISFIRWMRYILLVITLLLPSLYVAATTYHPQLIPGFLLISIAATREGIPFPAVVEAFLMEFTFEVLREAGIRLPKAIGQAVSIVGALVVGDAAVRAGIVSTPMVIVVATTGISSFVIPRYNFGFSWRFLRFPLLFLAGTLGFFGIGFGIIAIIIHLVNLTSFGVPYLTPLAPQVVGDLKDVLIRAPHWAMTNRPIEAADENKERIPEGQIPNGNQGEQRT